MTAVFDQAYPTAFPEAFPNANVATPPVNLTLPVVTGSDNVGGLLSGTNGTWDDASSFAYQWGESATDGGSLTPKAGQTSNTYTVTQADVDGGLWLAMTVTASNPEGSTEAVSNYVQATALVRSIDITAPAGGETYISGEALTVEASLQNVTTVNVYYSKNNGIAFSQIATAVSLPYQFLPTDEQATSEAVIRLIDSVGQVVADDSETFRVATTNPGAGETPIFPDIADVRLGSPAYGIVDGVTYNGTLDVYAEADLPSNRDVLDGVTFGNADAGVYVEAIAANVAEGVDFGPNSEYTGTLQVSGGTPVFPSADDVRLGSPNFGIVDGVTYIPNCRVPGVEQVEAGFQYDTNDSLTGTLAGGAYGPANTLVLMIRGDDYSLEFTDAAWKDFGMDSQTPIIMGLAGSAGVAEFGGSYDATKNVVTVPITSSESANLRSTYRYDIQGTISGAVKTLVRGQLQMYETYTDIPANSPLLPGWLG